MYYTGIKNGGDSPGPCDLGNLPLLRVPGTAAIDRGCGAGCHIERKLGESSAPLPRLPTFIIMLATGGAQ